jgi:hypothetical protein
MSRRLTLLGAAAFALAVLSLQSKAPHDATALQPLVGGQSSAVVPARQLLEPLPARRVAERLERSDGSPTGEVTTLDQAADPGIVDVCGRVVAAESGTPLAGVAVFERELRVENARGLHEPPAVRFPGPYPPDALTDARGEFHLRLPAGRSWRAEFAAAGRSPCQATLHTRHIAETVPAYGARAPSLPIIEVRLERSARIVGSVHGAQSGDFVEVAFRLRVQRGEGEHAELGDALALEWRRLYGNLDQAGRFEVPDVPAALPLRLSLIRNEFGVARVLLQEPEEPTLAPGDTRRVDWVLGAGGTLACTVHEADGVPVANTELWLLRPSLGADAVSGAVVTPTATTRTDERGAAVFEDVLTGEWIVAVARTHVRDGRTDDLAPARVKARVSSPGEVVHVPLVCHRGLTIDGRVLEANGAYPTAMVMVMARSESCEAIGYSRPKDQGAFRIGPLTPGRYEVRVVGSGRSEPQHVDAGARDLVFKLDAQRMLATGEAEPRFRGAR